MAYNKKKYTRINWKNRPSTATALGATNLNHMDVFLNDVDNALIEMDAGKLNLETANSMIASITFDKDKGLMTVRELNGTTYTYDWNVEKIPVSFSLSEDGILTMTTQDGTQFTANIADLIKDYVFDDSDTIAFTKEFQTEDNSYHVGASVKNGSIKAEHLDPDYRADIQNFSNVAQTAANDALTRRIQNVGRLEMRHTKEAKLITQNTTRNRQKLHGRPQKRLEKKRNLLLDLGLPPLKKLEL